MVKKSQSASSGRLAQRIASALQARKTNQLYRQRLLVESPQGPMLRVAGETLLSFCSNDYLGLAADLRLQVAMQEAANLYGSGSGASHLVTGHTSAHAALEEELAEFTGRERALLFSSGYMTNLGVLSALVTKNDTVLEDKLNHASLLDGGLFSGARFRRYRHLNTANLQRQLKTDAGQGNARFVVSDGVFSMDGDVAPLAELMNLCENHEATLVLDDAHGFGVLGKQGGGLAEFIRETGVVVNSQRLPVLIGTFGKAFGTAGAFVAGDESLIEFLIQFCRPYIYTTALPAVIAQATRVSLKIVQNETWRREYLNDLIRVFRQGCSDLNIELTNSNTPIQGLLLGTPERALQLSALLREEGILSTAIRPPTVPPGTSRLRLTLTAAHSMAEVNTLLVALERCLPQLISPNSELS